MRDENPPPHPCVMNGRTVWMRQFVRVQSETEFVGFDDDLIFLNELVLNQRVHDQLVRHDLCRAAPVLYLYTVLLSLNSNTTDRHLPPFHEQHHIYNEAAVACVRMIKITA